MAPKGIRIISNLTRLTDLHRMVARSDQQMVVPFWHVVSNDSLPHIRHLYHYRNISQFEADLDTLLSVFEPVSLSDYRQEISSRQGIDTGRGKPSVLLTFDDGLAECHSIIAPVLKKKGVPALFFLNNHFIDNRGLFYRYKVSLLLDRVQGDSSSMTRATEILRVPEDQVKALLLSVSYSQQILLDALAKEIGVDFENYLESHPVYMTTGEIMELTAWGFEIGAHSLDHPRMDQMKSDEVIEHVISSVVDLQQRMKIRVNSFAFPFSEAGISSEVITALMKQELTLFGISGIRKTGNDRFIQRIDMEAYGLPALDVMKIKYAIYLARRIAGKHTG